jgi:Flp pilus assembly protein TadG
MRGDRIMSGSPRRRDDERGAVLLIVAVSLIVLFGMLVLVVDLGLLVARKRVTVQAADAAALAAAQSCAARDGATSANAQANWYAIQNGAAAIATGYPRYSPSCAASSGIVTVRVRFDQELLFAPAIGLPTDAEVFAEATARWGGAGAGENMSPIMVNSNRLGDCQIPPPEGVTPEICAFWADNSPKSSDDPALSSNEWGTLDLRKDIGWDVAANANCTNPQPPEFESWMFEGYFEPLPVNYPDPTYVCQGSGHFGQSLNNLFEDAIEQELELFFPVNRPEGQVDKDGNLCPPGSGTSCTVHKYDIIGFARMVMIGLYTSKNMDDPNIHPYCLEHLRQNSNGRCIVTRWIDFTHEGLNPAEGVNFGVVPFQLIR